MPINQIVSITTPEPRMINIQIWDQNNVPLVDAAIRKSEDIAKKISIGKMNKFKEENSLLTQAWVMEPKKKVKDIIKELSINDLKIREFSRIKIGE